MPGGNPEVMPERPEVMPERPEGAASNGEKPSFFRGAKKTGIGDAPLTIVVSCEKGAELSAGLAVQNMSVEAQLLGYGTKILTSPTMALNGENSAEYKALLGIPEGMSVAAVMIVGKPAEKTPDGVDAVASASVRNEFDSVVTVIK